MAGVLQSCRFFRQTVTPIKHLKKDRIVSRCLSSKLANILKSNSERFSGNVDTNFQDAKVQEALSRIVDRNIDLGKVFSPRKEDLEVPSYQLLTDAEILEAEKSIKDEARKRLKMPPVMIERKEIDLELKNDPEINGHDESNFVFTDISSTANNRNRRIVVREPSGKLREATWPERDRMNFIYFPREGQTFEIQPMLTDEHLPVVFEQMRHVDVLDLVCLQCPPDSADYLRVHQRTYEDIENRRGYYVLESSRYHGGMIFHFVVERRIRGLLLHMVKEDRIEDAVDLIKLSNIIHPDTSIAMEAKTKNLDGKELLMAYTEEQGIREVIDLLAEDEVQSSNG